MSIACDIVVYAANELAQKECKCGHCTDACNNDCKSCLEAIHMDGNKRRYDCHYMRSYYIVSYLYKYKKEIRAAFTENINEISSHLSFSRKLKVVSFGCGPGTEIIGFYEFMAFAIQKKKISNLEIKYIGIDINNEWCDYFKITSDKVREGFDKIGIAFDPHFYHADVLKFNLNNEKIDILILPYVLSDSSKRLFRFLI